jgi:hypothetical protein
MKKSVSIALVGLFTLPAFAQRGDVPAPVKSAFAQKYPTAQKVKWEKEDANYEAEFHFGRQEMSAVFDATGTQLETEKEIPTSQLPAAVQASMKKAGRKIKEAAEITNARGEVFYEAEAGGKDYLFNAQGQPVQKTN